MLPEVFECPQCQRQFVFELVETSEDRSIYCPQCKRYLGEKDINFILLTEIEELTERLRFERERLEKDEAVYALTDCDAELRVYDAWRPGPKRCLPLHRHWARGRWSRIS